MLPSRARVAPIPSLLLLLLLLPASLLAQRRESELVPGTRIRIHAPEIDRYRFSGTLRQKTGDSLTVALRRGQTLAIHLDAIDRLEMSTGGRNRSLGALYGAGLGIVGGFICIAVCPTDDPGANLAPMSGMFIGIPVGILWLAPPRWQRVVLDVERRGS